MELDYYLVLKEDGRIYKTVTSSTISFLRCFDLQRGIYSQFIKIIETSIHESNELRNRFENERKFHNHILMFPILTNGRGWYEGLLKIENKKTNLIIRGDKEIKSDMNDIEELIKEIRIFVSEKFENFEFDFSYSKEPGWSTDKIFSNGIELIETDIKIKQVNDKLDGTIILGSELKAKKSIELPVDEYDYKKVRIMDAFIDKSKFIWCCLELKRNLEIFNIPSGFGKSLNLSMLKYFLMLDVDKNGNLMEGNRNKTLFCGDNEYLLKDLYISNYKNGLCMKHQGQYVVISISFKNFFDYFDEESDYATMIKVFYNEVYSSFLQSPYLINYDATSIKQNLDLIK